MPFCPLRPGGCTSITVAADDQSLATDVSSWSSAAPPSPCPMPGVWVATIHRQRLPPPALPPGLTMSITLVASGAVAQAGVTAKDGVSPPVQAPIVRVCPAPEPDTIMARKPV